MKVHMDKTGAIAVTGQPPDTVLITAVVDDATSPPCVRLFNLNGEPYGKKDTCRSDKPRYRVSAYAVTPPLPMFLVPPSLEALLKIVKPYIVATAESKAS